MKVIHLVTTGLLLTTTPAVAEEDINSGNFWLPHCQRMVTGDIETIQDSLAVVCSGMVMGISQVTDLMQEQFRYCPPNGVTPRQTLATVVAFLQRNPSLLNEHFSWLAAFSLVRTWPCKR